MKRAEQKGADKEIHSTLEQLSHQNYETPADATGLAANLIEGVYPVNGLLEKDSWSAAHIGFGFYEIDAWGEQLIGASAPQRCTLSGVAKRNSADAPHAVANEFICARLGLLIGLPVPPGAVVTTGDGKLAYVSLRFGPKGEDPPPLSPKEFVEDNPSIAAGVIAFDCWIGNPDRHQHNLAYVRGDPRIPVTVFDHSHALLGIQAGAAVQLLRRRLDDPVVSGILRQYITSSREFRDWASRIRAVSSELIRDICRTMNHPDGISAEECSAAAEFLIHRKDRVLEQIWASKGRVPNVQQWELDEN
ncbi:MAG: hypothetical protein QOI57_2633 [Rubrobacteraceae bacterium]|jgi:hypothetical protein|nr:hypothetical protein [Rubrobacteraceae bacterium]